MTTNKQPTLAEIRARLNAATNGNNNNNNSDSKFCKFYEIPLGSEISLRFIPDGDTNNPDYFFRKSKIINLPFAGIKGKSEDPVTVTVPCMYSYMDKEKDAICDYINSIQKELPVGPNGKPDYTITRPYWVQTSFIYQGFLRNIPSGANINPSSTPIRQFRISKDLHNLIVTAILDPDFGETSPTDFEQGTDFKVRKGSRPGEAGSNRTYNNYGTSGFARSSSALTAEELVAIEEHGIPHLSSFLLKKPTEEEKAIIWEMFNASLNGEAYDPDKWGNYYKPYEQNRGEGITTPKATTITQQEAVAETPVVIPENQATAPANTLSIIEQIRARKAQQEQQQQ